MKAFVLISGAALAIWASPLIGQIQEREPNDSPATADTVTRGSTVQATIAPYNQATGYRDVDYFMLTANAGDTIFVDIDADEFGTHMDMALVLYAADGKTAVAYNDNWDGLDPHIEYVATATGPYYVEASTSLVTTPWDNPAPYTIHFYQVKCPDGPDPEPNDTTTTATSATIGQTIQGRSCPSSDVDFFKFDLNPGTYEFNFVMDPHERPSFGSAANISGWIALYAPDGKTQLAATDGEGTPDRIEYTVTTPATYFLRATIWPGGIRYTYSISTRMLSAPAPGDPITVRAQLAVNGSWHDDGAVVDRNSDIIVSDMGFKIWRITPQGAKSQVGPWIEQPAGLAWDADGNLLIVNAGDEMTSPTTEAGVFKLSPSGQLTRFITDPHASWSIAMVPDGSLWLTAWKTKALEHYDAQGKLIASYDVSAASGTDGPRYIALGPNGDPYFATVQDIYRLHDGTAGLVIHYDPKDGRVGAFAFDIQGNIYVPNPDAGVVNVHDITGKWLQTIAYEPTAPTRVFFGRDADGSTNARLYAIDSGRLIELNPAGARARGLPVQFDKQQETQDPTVTDAAADLLKGGGVLSDAQRTDLDQRGNQNGRYDLGDLRALLIRAGVVHASRRTH